MLLGMPARVCAVAGVTLTQLVRMRLFLVPAVLAALFLLLQFIPYQEHIGIEFQGVAQLELLKDISLGCMQLFGLIFCVAATAMLLPKDTEDRILYTILCKPVPRFDYLLGKVAGVLALLVLMVGLLDGLMCALLALREADLCRHLTEALAANGYTPAEMAPYLDQVHEAGNSWNMQRGIAATLLGYAVLTSLTMLISSVTSGSVVSIIFALGAYFIGMCRSTLVQMFHSSPGMDGTARLADTVCGVLLPDFRLFAVADSAAAGVAFSGTLLLQLAGLAVLYMFFHLLTATWIFSRKEF